MPRLALKRPVDRTPENARDRALVEQARAGDLDAFNRLVELYQDYLYAMTVRVVRDRDVAEDAVQEAFFSAYRNLDRFSGSSFRAWLTRIAINAAHDILRKRKRRPSEPYPEWEDDSWQPPAPASEGPEQVSMVAPAARRHRPRHGRHHRGPAGGHRPLRRRRATTTARSRP